MPTRGFLTGNDRVEGNTEAPERAAGSHADFPRLERLFDVHEVAAECKVSAKSLHKWAREGRIPAVKFGRLWRFRKSAIDEYLNSKAS